MFFAFIYVYWCPTRFSYQMMFVWFNRNTTGGTETANPSCAHEFTPGFSQWGSCFSIFSFPCNVLQIVVCPLVLFLLAIVLSVLLQFTVSDQPFGIFKPFVLSQQQPSITEIRIGTTSFGISNQLRDNIYVICRCCLIVATYIYGKLTMGKLKSSLLS